MAQALQFSSDMKLGHYMKVPPRSMFWCQIVATVVAGTTQLGVQQWYVPCFAKSNLPAGWFDDLGQDVQPHSESLRAAAARSVCRHLFQ